MLQDKRGSQCISFECCGHVFCKSCVVEYFEVRIKDGSVKNICCPEENSASEAVPSQIIINCSTVKYLVFSLLMGELSIRSSA